MIPLNLLVNSAYQTESQSLKLFNKATFAAHDSMTFLSLSFKKIDCTLPVEVLATKNYHKGYDIMFYIMKIL